MKENSEKIITGKETPKDPAIENILKAYVGYKKEKFPELKELHDQSEEITLQNLGLNERRKVKRFSEKILRLGIQAHNLIRKKGLIPNLSESTTTAVFEKTALWED